MYYALMSSPVGTLVLAGEGSECVETLSFARDEEIRLPPDADTSESNFSAARQQLGEYFSGERQQFDFPMRLNGRGFRRQVLESLLKVPFGKTISYKELGASIGKPNAARAVGGAVGSNPLAIVVPCHRVLATGGGIGGFGGGLEAKRTLLRLEGADIS